MQARSHASNQHDGLMVVTMEEQQDGQENLPPVDGGRTIMVSGAPPLTEQSGWCPVSRSGKKKMYIYIWYVYIYIYICASIPRYTHVFLAHP